MVLGVMVNVVATVMTMAVFYRAVVREIMLYGSVIWVVTESLMEVI